MERSAPAHRLAVFGTFELDLRTGELRKRGVKLHLQEQPFRVLAMLVERAGDLVLREELRQRLWPDAIFVDFDLGLNKAVAKLRRILGDSAENPRFIETLERRGYRFVADVAHPEGTAGTAAPPAALPPVVRLVLDDRSIPLPAGTHLIGREPAAAVWIDSSLVSRRHASITIGADSMSVEDLGSRNGTFVNGERLIGPRPLGHADEIRIGHTRIVVSAAPALPTEPQR